MNIDTAKEASELLKLIKFCEAQIRTKKATDPNDSYMIKTWETRRDGFVEELDKL